jgi:Scaffold protein Nfu/NifU N terminal
MKFTLDVRVDGMLNARTEQEAASDPLAAAVLALPGVSAVFRTADFVTVTREPDVPWDDLVAAIEAVISI